MYVFNVRAVNSGNFRTGGAKTRSLVQGGLFLVDFCLMYAQRASKL